MKERTERRRARSSLAGAAIIGGALVGVIGIGAAQQRRPEQPQPQQQAPQPQQPMSSESRATPERAKIDPRADALLKKTSAFLAKQQRFAVHSEGEIEVVLENGQKLEFPFEGDVKVQRPNKLRADRRGARTDLQFFYDGRQFVLFGTIAKMYAKAPAPPSLDAAIENARETLGIDAPGADLLFENAYAGLIPDVTSAVYLGTEIVRGQECEHAAFRGKDVDFQIWVRTGNTPTPCRYVVTTTNIEGKPEYAADFVNWNLSPKFEADVFTFTPPPGAEQISFLTAAEMKKHATERVRQGDAR